MKTTTKLMLYPMAILTLLFSTLTVQSQNVTTPRGASPASEVKQTIGLSTITVNYSRPKLTSRAGVDRSGKIWGQQVPFGFEATSFATSNPMPWRAGANENTTISFSDAVKIEGKEIAAGTYGLHMAVYEDGKTTVILSDNSTSWGSFYYNEAEDALRVDVMSKPTTKTKVLTFEFVEYGSDYAVLSLKWDEKEIPMKIELNTHDLVIENFVKELRSIPGFGWQGHNAAARYTLNNNTHLDQGLAWAEIATQRNNSFPTLTTKAGILNALGKVEEANAIYDTAASTATVVQINALGYQMLGANQNEKAIVYFKMNVENDPTNANGYDSLGDGYKAVGDTKNAITNYKKALTLNPIPAVKTASEASLKALGAL